MKSQVLNSKCCSFGLHRWQSRVALKSQQALPCQIQTRGYGPMAEFCLANGNCADCVLHRGVLPAAPRTWHFVAHAVVLVCSLALNIGFAVWICFRSGFRRKTPAAAVSCGAGVTCVSTRTRTVSTQSQTRYTWYSTSPRCVPLPEQSSGVWAD